MFDKLVCSCAGALLLAAALPAQENLPVAEGKPYALVPGAMQPSGVLPVPTRITSEIFGGAANPSCGLDVRCFAGGDEASAVRVSGGCPGAPVILLAACAPEVMGLPFGILLVSPDCVAVPGTFDDAGNFDLPIDLGRRALCENTFYFQAVELLPKDRAPVVDLTPQLSRGMSLTYRAGNRQGEDVRPIGVPFQAILCRELNPYTQVQHTLLVRALAAESYGWTLGAITQDRERDVTMVFLTLGGPGGVLVGDRWRGTVAELGPVVGARIEVWVALDHGGSCLAFARAAVIDTHY